jgi:mono/diheme cytochrome c family protein
VKPHWARVAIGSAVLVLIATASVPVAAQFNNGRAARPEVTLPKGQVRQVILKSCTTCHGIDEYAYYAMDRDGWGVMLDNMVKKGAVLADADRAELLDWLVGKFGPTSKAFPRNFVAPVDSSLFADDTAAREYLERACQNCHGLDRVDNARFAESRWRAIVVDMKARGAAVADQNVEALIEYLTRTRGANPAN